MRTVSFILILSVLGCSTPSDQPFVIFSETYNFDKNMWGWEGEFTDYPVDATDEYGGYGWAVDYTEVPSTVGSKMAIQLSCENVGDDVFMFIKKRLSGLKPNTRYSLVFEVEMISNVPAGETVILKAGATFVEPHKVVRNGMFELNIDKGSPTTSGKDAVVIGQLTPLYNADYSYIQISNLGADRHFTAYTNQAGELWLLVGTESGYPGLNTVYFTNINVVLSAS